VSTALSCRSGVELLMEYLEGELSPELRASVDEHVASCPRCTAFVESYRRLPETLRRATVAALPVDLESSLLEFLRKRRG